VDTDLGRTLLQIDDPERALREVEPIELEVALRQARLGRAMVARDLAGQHARRERAQVMMPTFRCRARSARLDRADDQVVLRLERDEPRPPVPVGQRAFIKRYAEVRRPT
jgi:hypothetical protein